MSSRVRLVLVVGALVLPALALARWAVATSAVGLEQAEVTIPTELGEWEVVEDRPLDEDALSVIEPDAYTLRLYVAPDRHPVWVYVGIYIGRSGTGRGHHDPEVCYPAQGWEILGSRSVPVAVVGDETLQAKQLAVHQGTLEETVVYWFQPADRWPVSDAPEQIAQLVDAVRGRPQYAFVRLSAIGDERQVLDDVMELASVIARPIRGDVEGL